ncbi:hypothetical protein B0H17DRAFT_1131120 [Mycena rosella]|uniref:Uncharacterized protein n=1 Tax=Mycena rosella TaxID=1033263 RepID=A0AAD7DNT7_MYCRO|nr:hypothetical protein B0H17DRAFT_1131120 [Mycena rosella]
MSSSLAILPVELCLYIFFLFLYGGNTEYWVYYRMRCTLMNISGACFRLVIGSPVLWLEIMVSPCLSVQAVRTHLSRSAGSINIHFSFSRDDIISYQLCIVHALEVEDLVGRMFGVVQPSASLWLSVHVESDDREAWIALQTFLARVATPYLLQVSLTYLRTTDVYDTFRVDPASPAPWFNGSTARLRDLSMAGAFCTRLEFIALRVISFDYTLPPLAVITSQSIVALDADIDNLISTGLLASFRLPRLRRLALHIATSTHVVAALECAELYKPVTLLVLTGNMLLHDTHERVLALFPNLVWLDLTRASVSVFVQLCNLCSDFLDGAGRTTFLTSLKMILLAHEDLEDIKAFAVLHRAHAASDWHHVTLCRVCSPASRYAHLAPKTKLVEWLSLHLLRFEHPAHEPPLRCSLETTQWNVYPNISPLLDPVL